MSIYSFRITLIILSSLLLNACSTKKPPQQNNPFPKTTIKEKKVKKQTVPVAPPEWYSSSQNNSETYLYGFGSADSPEQATKNALADMAQRLQVTVSATTSLKILSKDNNISQTLIQDVSTTTADLNIPKYTTLNHANINNTYYIKIQINKLKTIKTLNLNIKSLIRESEELIKNAKNKNSIYRFKIAQKVSNNIKIIKSSLRTLLILNPEADIYFQMHELNEITNRLLNLKRNLSIYIDRQNSGYFYNSLEKFLKVQNYNITNKENTANILITIKLKDYNDSAKNGSYCIDSKIELQASDNNSSQLSPKEYSIKACSNKGRSFTIEKAVDFFYSQLKTTESIY